MNELDREMILAQRGEERDAAIERRRNAKMAAQAQQAAMAVSIAAHLFLPGHACFSSRDVPAAMTGSACSGLLNMLRRLSHPCVILRDYCP